MRPLVRKPSPQSLRAFLDAQARLDLSYLAVGATNATPPPGYRVNHTRVQLGTGAAAYQRACDALCQWRQLSLGWIEPWPADTPLQTGAAVALLARSLGLWWLNAFRIVYTIQEPARFGFGYGTLPAHVGCGEERFLVECDAAGAVWYDLRAFSRPRGLLPHLGTPWLRRTQRRFARDSAAAMLRAVAGLPGS